MIVQIFFNTDGYLGAWGTKRSLPKANLITQSHIDFARKNDTGLIVEIPDKDIQLFHKAIDCRDMVCVLPTASEKYDVEFGNLKLKFNDMQKEKDMKSTLEAHKFNKKQNEIEKAIFEK